MTDKPRALSALILLGGALLTASCTSAPIGWQGASLVMASGTQAVGGATLTVRITGLSPDRKVQAVMADLERLLVRVRSAGGREYVQVVEKSAFSGAQADVAFAGLPPGSVTIEVNGSDATGAQIGHARASTVVESGTSKAVNVSLFLFTKQPVTQPVDLALEATVMDSTATSVSNTLNDAVMDEFHVSGANGDLKYYMDQGGSIYIDDPSMGPQLYSYLYPPNDFDPPVSVIQRVPDYMDRGGNAYIRSDKFVEGYSPNGRLLGRYAVPNAIPRTWRSVEADSSGNVWICNGNQISKFSSTGTLIGHYDLGQETGAVVHDPAQGIMWVALNKASKLVRLDLNGQVLATLEAGLPGDVLGDIALDPSGNIWALGLYGGTLAKVDPQGKFLGYTQLQGYAVMLTTDQLGNVWVACDDDMNQLHLFHVAPNGKVIGSMEPRNIFGPYLRSFRLDIDPAGNLWLSRHHRYAVFGEGGLLRIKP